MGDCAAFGGTIEGGEKPEVGSGGDEEGEGRGEVDGDRSGRGSGGGVGGGRGAVDRGHGRHGEVRGEEGEGITGSGDKKEEKSKIRRRRGRDHRRLIIGLSSPRTCV